jgi:hypothetical protein
VFVASSVNGWANDDLTIQWLDSCMGTSLFKKRLLVWDSYRCHISEKTKKRLKAINAVAAVVPGGCTKYIQPADLSWNKPFKARLREFYDKWMEGDADKSYTAGGNLRAPTKKLLIDWIVTAWNELDISMIVKSFKSCGLTNNLDGTEDEQIHCFKVGHDCRNGWTLLQDLRNAEYALENEIELDEEEDEDQTEENEVVIYDDDIDHATTTNEQNSDDEDSRNEAASESGDERNYGSGFDSD